MTTPCGQDQGVGRADVPRPKGGPGGGPGATAGGAVQQGAGGPQPFATFWVRHSGTVGQEVLDQDGRIIAWTTDGWAAQVICKLLNDNAGLLGRKQEGGEHQGLHEATPHRRP
jgi:hypothetical protein